jgi:hypothetical protein
MNPHLGAPHTPHRVRLVPNLFVIRFCQKDSMAVARQIQICEENSCFLLGPTRLFTRPECSSLERFSYDFATSAVRARLAVCDYRFCPTRRISPPLASSFFAVPACLSAPEKRIPRGPFRGAARGSARPSPLMGGLCRLRACLPAGRPGRALRCARPHLGTEAPSRPPPRSPCLQCA